MSLLSEIDFCLLVFCAESLKFTRSSLVVLSYAVLSSGRLNFILSSLWRPLFKNINFNIIWNRSKKNLSCISVFCFTLTQQCMQVVIALSALFPTTSHIFHIFLDRSQNKCLIAAHHPWNLQLIWIYATLYIHVTDEKHTQMKQTPCCELLSLFAKENLSASNAQC